MLLANRWSKDLAARILAPVQQRADEGRPDPIVITNEQHGQRYRENQRELDRPVQRHLREHHLQKEHEGQMREKEVIRAAK